MQLNVSRKLFAFAYSLSALLVSSNAKATNTGQPWETNGEKVIDSLTGPVATYISFGVVVVAAIAFVNSEGGGLMGKIIKWVAALSFLGGSTIIVTNFTGLAKGILLP